MSLSKAGMPVFAFGNGGQQAETFKITFLSLDSVLPLKFCIFSPVFCSQFQKASISPTDKSVKLTDLPVLFEQPLTIYL